MHENQIDYTVVVQAAPTVAETQFLLTLYDQYRWIAGVVGWLDFEAVDFRDQFEGLHQHQGFVGIRPMIQDIEDDRWILRPRVMENIGLLVEEDFPLDLLVLPQHLPYILELLKQFPAIRAVINHAAKPNIKERVLKPWQDQIQQIASFDNVMCKLSGLITEADHDRWKSEDLKPYVDHIVDVFGADSVMFGSDWPVCLKAGSYSEVYRALHEILDEKLSPEQLEKVFGENAVQFYHLNTSR